VTARVLVVDDHRGSRDLLLRAVEQLGYDGVGAADGAEALRRLRAPNDGRAIDVVLLDLVMPVLDGLSTLATIKADERLRDLPVLVVSAVDDLDSVVQCIELGATDHLPKPANRAVLAARLRASLAAKRLRDLERDHLEQVDRVIEAARAIEAGEPDLPPGLAAVSARDDALGALARTVQGLATEVRTRESALRAQVELLRDALDQQKLDAQVREVTGSEHYRRLTREAATLRQRLHGPANVGSDPHDLPGEGAHDDPRGDR
jgi:CheY-like chemotaxis protein